MLNKFKEKVVLPIGAVIPFSGEPNLNIQQQYILCAGDSISGKGKFKKLFDAIGYAHGEGDLGKFFLPDYRGFFLRGVDNQAVQSRRDPDADSRTAPMPKNEEGKQGNSGDLVGSVQNDATAYPQTGPFVTSLPHLPSEEGNQTISGTVKKSFNWNSGSVTANVTEGGGDDETRPVNINVDWYIKYE